MKVVLIYRRGAEGGHSIETVFHSIAAELRNQVEVVEYEVGSRWDLLNDVVRLRRLRADVYHVTGGVYYLALLLPGRKTVLTIHDIGHYLFGLKGWKRWVYKRLWLSWPMRAAGAITAVSRETEARIKENFDRLDRAVEPIENCHSALFRPVPKPFDAACPMILQVGTKANKNVPRLAEALRGIPCRLDLIGPLDSETRAKLADCGVEYSNRAGLTREEIIERYAACDIVSFVSLGEGFGVPIIEAQASGRPLITANVSPMREIAGDGACLVDPMSVTEIRAGLLRIISDSDYRAKIVQKGLENVRRYSPERVSGRYLDLYRGVARI